MTSKPLSKFDKAVLLILLVGVVAVLGTSVVITLWHSIGWGLVLVFGIIGGLFWLRYIERTERFSGYHKRGK